MTPELLELEAATPGWLHSGEGETLARYAEGLTVIEIGSYCGKSTLWLASTAEHVISIDPHRGNPEMAPGQDCHHPEVWDHEIGSVDSAPFMRRTLHKAGFDDKVTMICATGGTAASFVAPFSHGMTFIDGDHSGDAPMNDYRAWAPDTGVLAFHDSAIGAVATACAQATKDGWTLADVVADSLRVFTR